MIILSPIWRIDTIQRQTDLFQTLFNLKDLLQEPVQSELKKVRRKKNNWSFCGLDLREILEQNNLYDEVLGQINNRLTMRETSRSNAGAEASQKKSSNSSRYRSVGGRSGNVLPSIRKPPSSELAR
jgi:hypothetical protein